MLNVTFEAAFRNLFVYNILFEDAEVDGRYLGLDEHSRILGISAAGCGLASMIRFRPQHIEIRPWALLPAGTHPQRELSRR